jgi:hypothetical protein
MRTLSPAMPKDRFEVYRFFNGLSMEAKEGLDRRQNRIPLVKTFLLEHVSTRGRTPKPPGLIFNDLNVGVRMIDDRFMELKSDVTDPETKQLVRMTTGFLEQYDERFFAYYTCEGSAEAKNRVKNWIQAPDLDHAWFSSPLLQVLWNKDVSGRGNDRFGRIVFQHESIFEMPDDSTLETDDEESDEETDESPDDCECGEEDRKEIERRKARFEMRDRIGSIQGALGKLQHDYDPLSVLYALRFPSRIGRGSHDLYQNGQVTNRTDSFEDHRNTVRYLYRIYNSVLESTEQSAWQGIRKGTGVSLGLKGVPLIVRFKDPLSRSTFDQWVHKAFQKRNAFKLWGNPIRLGPTKVHVYGADRHLWQPIHIELTAQGVVAVLPQGTCGNTFHRLVANIQRFVCPKIEAWLGSDPFDDLVGRWPSRVEENDEN